MKGANVPSVARPKIQCEIQRQLRISSYRLKLLSFFWCERSLCSIDIGVSALLYIYVYIYTRHAIHQTKRHKDFNNFIRKLTWSLRKVSFKFCETYNDFLRNSTPTTPSPINDYIPKAYILQTTNNITHFFPLEFYYFTYYIIFFI